MLNRRINQRPCGRHGCIYQLPGTHSLRSRVLGYEEIGVLRTPRCIIPASELEGVRQDVDYLFRCGKVHYRQIVPQVCAGAAATMSFDREVIQVASLPRL